VVQLTPLQCFHLWSASTGLSPTSRLGPVESRTGLPHFRFQSARFEPALEGAGCGWTPGPSSTRPSSRAKREPCHGHFTLSSIILPSESGPPRLAQLSASGKIRSPRLASRIGVSLYSTRRIAPSHSSDSASTVEKHLEMPDQKCGPRRLGANKPYFRPTGRR
jgi:hypothetical protein